MSGPRTPEPTEAPDTTWTDDQDTLQAWTRDIEAIGEENREVDRERPIPRPPRTVH